MSGADRSAGMVLAAADPVAAMKAMRRARRRRYVARVDVMEVLYRVYLGALAALFVLAFLAGALHEVPADPASVEGIRAHAPAVIAVAVALLVYAGLRAGARGGPLAIEAAEVHYTLLAPVSRRTALRPTALAQLRIATISGAIFGAVVGNFVFRRFPGSAVEWIGSLAAFGALVPIAVLGAALVASGRRVRPGLAAALGVALIAWSALDLALGWNTSPTTMLGDLATLPLQHGGEALLAAVGAVLALTLCGGGLLGIGGLGLEAARRRAQLVAEIRFSAAVKDVRTVVLLRRQLASERPRRRPWLRLGGGRAAQAPIWRRDWQSFLRWPLVRIVRVLLLAVAAGALAVAGFSQTPVLFALPGPLLFVAALDLIEPLAQESDHPTRRALLPRPVTQVMRRHLVAPIVACCVVVAIAALAAAAIGGDPGLALGVGAVSVIPVGLVLIGAAAFSATNDPYEYALVPELELTMAGAPIFAAMLTALPALAAWAVAGGHLHVKEHGDAAAIGVAASTDVVLLILFAITLGFLTWRFDKAERGAM
ncbi:MAG TPA: hypothetical protein VJL81_15405 [Solirubrobacterales bacterium]|nr:hypothetical protein [Solirubrobacterales bacterium]